MVNEIDYRLYEKREQLEMNQLSIAGTGHGHWRMFSDRSVEWTISKIEKLIEERGLSKGVLRIRPGDILEVATDEICVRDLYREVLEEEYADKINQEVEFSEKENYLPLAIELYKQTIAEHPLPNTRQWLEELSDAPALWDGLLYDHFDGHHGGFVLRYADNPDGDTIETASVLQPFHSWSDWALIELTRRTLPKDENERLNQSIFDRLETHGIEHKIVVGHWDNYAYPYQAVRFCFIERPEDMPLDAFRRLVSDCVTKDKSRNTCAVINQLHTECPESPGLISNKFSRILYKSNYAVKSDGTIYPYDDTHFADIYAKLRSAGYHSIFTGPQSRCQFVIDGPESSYCPFIKY